MPALWEHAPDVELVVAGKGSEEIEAARPAGAAERLRPRPARRLPGSRAAVAVPLLEGGGSPLKFVEALAYRVPVAATPLAAAGLEVRAGEHYAEGEADGASFAAALREALDPGARQPARRRRPRAGRARVLDRGAGAAPGLVKIVSVMTGAAPGGAEFAAVELLDALIERGHEAVMLSDSPEIGRETAGRGAPARARAEALGQAPGRSLALKWPALRTGGCARRWRPRRPTTCSSSTTRRSSCWPRACPPPLRPQVAWCEWGPVPRQMRQRSRPLGLRPRRPRRRAR